MNQNKKRIKIAAYVLAGVVATGTFSISASAAGVSSVLPVAGLALTLEEGTGQHIIRANTKSNIASAKEAKKDSLINSIKKDIAAESKETAASIPTEIETELQTASVDDQTEATSTMMIEEAITAGAAKVVDVSTSATVSASIKKQSSVQGSKEVKEADATENLSDEEKGFSKLVIAKVNDYVNIRSMASEEGEILGKLYDKSVGEFVTEKDGWYKITSGSVTGYVKAEYCVTGSDAIDLAKKVGTRIATVNTTTLKVREDKSQDSPVLGLVPIEEDLSVVEEYNGWVKVDIEEGFGYVSADYVDLRTDFVKAESIEEERARLEKEEAAKRAAEEAARRAEEKIAEESGKKKKSSSASTSGKSTASTNSSSASSGAAVSGGGSGAGSAVVNYAMQFVGNPYVYGGTSLTNGADCSGFVMSVYKNFGVSLPHSSSADRGVGYDVGGLSNAQPGDLVCYSGHVAIYAGNGQIVHASTSKTGIIVSNANYRTPVAVRRIF